MWATGCTHSPHRDDVSAREADAGCAAPSTVTRVVRRLQERDPLHGSGRQGGEALLARKRSDTVEPDRLPCLELSERASSRTCNEGRIPIVSRMGNPRRLSWRSRPNHNYASRIVRRSYSSSARQLHVENRRTRTRIVRAIKATKQGRCGAHTLPERYR